MPTSPLARTVTGTDASYLREALAALEACRTFLGVLEMDQLRWRVLDTLLQVLGRRRGIARFAARSTDRAEPLVFRGLTDGEVAACRVLSPADVRTVSIEREGAWCMALGAAGVASAELLAVPLGVPALGAAWILGDERPVRFLPWHADLAELVAEQAAIALANAEAFTSAREAALTDEVTGLYNARYLRRALAREFGRVERYGGPLSLLFIDVDCFKQVNECYGHLAGSQLLRDLGVLLIAAVRGLDTVARVGGDEFAVVLVDTDESSARLVADRIRAAVAGTAFRTLTGVELRVSVSIGIAGGSSAGSSPLRLFDNADRAMYRAKSLGRNRVESASDRAA